MLLQRARRRNHLRELGVLKSVFCKYKMGSQADPLVYYSNDSQSSREEEPTHALEPEGNASTPATEVQATTTKHEENMVKACSGSGNNLAGQGSGRGEDKDAPRPRLVLLEGLSYAPLEQYGGS